MFAITVVLLDYVMTEGCVCGVCAVCVCVSHCAIAEL